VVLLVCLLLLLLLVRRCVRVLWAALWPKTSKNNSKTMMEDAGTKRHAEQAWALVQHNEHYGSLDSVCPDRMRLSNTVQKRTKKEGF
jgi:hypothetical protein